MSNNDTEFLRSEAYRYFKLVLLVLYMYIVYCMYDNA